MRYTGNICDGCKEVFIEGDDIVVCPECATPQHRDCYDKNGKCVNEHLHSEGFQWQGEGVSETQISSSTLAKEKVVGEPLYCPNCNYANKPGAEVCEQCGMKFTMFGKNIVEQLQKEQAEQKASQPAGTQELPDYTPPFTVGEGEGFEQAPTQQQDTVDPQKVEYFDENDEVHIFKGPYPDGDTTFGVRTNTVGAFIRNNADTFIRKFKMSELTGSSCGFNWVVFFFGPYWFFYRKLFKPGIILFTIQFCISLLVLPFSLDMTALMESLMTITDEAALDAFLTQAQSTLLPIYAMLGIELVINLVFAFKANTLYKNYVYTNIEKAKSMSKRSEKITVFAKQGGTSFMYLAFAYLAEMLLSNLISMFIL